MAGDRALHLVLDQHKKEEDEALEQYGQAHQAVISFRKQLEQLRQFRAMYLSELQQKTQSGMDMNVFSSYQNFLTKLESIEKRQELGLLRLEDQEKRMQQEYLRRQQKRKVIESLLERHRLEEQLREANNPYSQKKMRDYLDSRMQGRESLKADDLPMDTKEDLLSILAAVAFAGDSGYQVKAADTYVETDSFSVREFEIRRGKGNGRDRDGA